MTGGGWNPREDRDDVSESAWNWDEILRSREHAGRWLQPYEELLPFIRLMRERGVRRVHDLGCGPGRHLVLLARAGFEVSGSDSSPSAIAAAAERLRREGLDARLQHADMASEPLPEGLDAVVCVHAIYHQTAAGIERTLANVHAALRPGGLFFVTFNSTATDSFRSGKYRRLDDRTLLKREAGGIGTTPHHYVAREHIDAFLRDFRLLRVVHREERDHEDGFRAHARWIVWAERTATDDTPTGS